MHLIKTAGVFVYAARRSFKLYMFKRHRLLYSDPLEYINADILREQLYQLSLTVGSIETSSVFVIVLFIRNTGYFRNVNVIDTLIDTVIDTLIDTVIDTFLLD
jgi:hypothetical protein